MSDIELSILMKYKIDLNEYADFVSYDHKTPMIRKYSITRYSNIFHSYQKQDIEDQLFEQLLGTLET